MRKFYTVYADALRAANERARLIGIEVAIRKLDNGRYFLQHRHEYCTDGKLIAITKPE